MSTTFVTEVNVMFAPIIGLVLILVDYWGKESSDKIMRWLMTACISATLITMLSDLAGYAVDGVPGQFASSAGWAAGSVRLAFQILCFYILALFFDYSVNLNQSRLRRQLVFVASMFAVQIIVVLANLSSGFIFTYTPDNVYTHGRFYFLQLILSYSVLFFAFYNATGSKKNMNKSQAKMGLIAVIPVTVGSVCDLVFSGVMLMWPSFFVSLLFCYLFVTRMNTLMDSLTGVYNRRACDEYLLELSKPGRTKDYFFIMIDLDKFKEINDKLGHAEGDNALKDAARLLRTTVRRTDFVGRYGGDEFVIIMASKGAGLISERIKNNFDSFNAKKERPYEVLLSLGNALYTADDPRTPQEFLSYVDELMYNEKAQRRKKQEAQ